jgi:hypothetical protein
LGSTLSLEWIVSLGILCGIPQLCELILEYGAGTAICKILPQILNSTIFFMFQNKTIATAVKQGAYSGDAKYLYTGRPLANIHYTWRDNYLCYCHSHFYPAFSLFIVIMMYHLLTGINTQGTLPMVLVIMSACVWLSAPVILTPFPSITLLKQDLMGFWDFITAPVRSDELSAMVGDDISEELPTGSNEQAGNRRKRRRDPLKPEQVRSLQEWAFSRELQDMHSTTWRMKLGTALSSSFLAFVLVLVLPANILDYLLVFLYVFMIRWLIVICALSRNVNNLLSFLTFFIWGLIPLLSWRLIGDRGSSNLVEYVICFIVFVSILNVLRLWVLFAASLRLTCFSKDVVVRFTYVFFLKSDIDTAAAMILLVINTVLSLVLILISEMTCCLPGFPSLHTWWLLNRNVAFASAKKVGFVPGRTRSLPNVDNRRHSSTMSMSSFRLGRQGAGPNQRNGARAQAVR